MTQTDANKQAVRRIYDEAVNAGRTAVLADLIAPEFTGPDGARGPAAFEAFLLVRLDAGRVDALVAEAARRVASDPAGVRAAPLASALGLSQDRLEKRFRRAVGTTPKRLASILRLRRAVEAYRAGETLTRTAADAGYFDQSHFNRAFRAATGLTPRAFFGAGEHC